MEKQVILERDGRQVRFLNTRQQTYYMLGDGSDDVSIFYSETNRGWLITAKAVALPADARTWPVPKLGDLPDLRPAEFLLEHAAVLLAELRTRREAERRLTRALGDSILQGEKLIAALRRAWEHDATIADLLGCSGGTDVWQAEHDAMQAREQAVQARERAVQARERAVLKRKGGRDVPA